MELSSCESRRHDIRLEKLFKSRFDPFMAHVRRRRFQEDINVKGKDMTPATQLDGAPVDWVPLDPVYGNLNSMGLSARASHPNAGRLFIDLVLSRASQETIRAQGRVPDRVDVLPDPPKLARGFTAVFTANEAYANFDRYVKLFQETFGSK